MFVPGLVEIDELRKENLIYTTVRFSARAHTRRKQKTSFLRSGSETGHTRARNSAQQPRQCQACEDEGAEVVETQTRLRAPHIAALRRLKKNKIWLSYEPKSETSRNQKRLQLDAWCYLSSLYIANAPVFRVQPSGA